MGMGEVERPPLFLSMTFRSPRRRTYRQRVDGEWVTIYLSKLYPDIWNVGLAISKSKRSQNDWYQNKENKRARRVGAQRKNRSLKPMMVLHRLLKRAIDELPEDHSLVAFPSSTKKITLTTYAQRFGFQSHRMTDEQRLWVLVKPQCREDQPEWKHTSGAYD